jgi:hypothetical protein
MKRNALFAVIPALIFVLSAHAATYDVTVALDTDRHASTGCTVTTPAGTFAGVEQLITSRVNVSGSVATTTGVTRQTCAGGGFTTPVATDTHSWPAGLTTGGTFFVETHITPTDLGLTTINPMRMAFFVTDFTHNDAVMTNPAGTSLIFPDPDRRRVVVPGAPVRTITLDGAATDWTGIGPIATGGAGTPDLRILNAYAFTTGSDIFFAVRFQANHNAPTANDDSYTLDTVGGTLNVPAGTGVLANDTDPNSLPLSAILVAGVQHGTLSLNANGSFAYTNDGSAATLDTFEYKATNGTLESNTAQVQIGIGAGSGPPPPPTPTFTSADHTTFTAGTPGSFLVITAPAHPTSTIVIDSGSLPNGVSFHDNGDGTATLSGTALFNTCGVYHLTFKATNVVGTATQNFTLNVIQAPSFSSPNATTFTVGVPGTFTVAAFGCPTPSISESGALPNGVTFVDNGDGSGTLAGTPGPGTAGTYILSFTATSSSGSATQSPFTLTIVCGSTIAVHNPATTTGTVNVAFSQTFTQTGAVGAVTFSLNSGTLPAGLTLAATGTLSGTPTQTGTFPITVKATDSSGCSGVGPTYNLTIGCQTITVNNPATNTGTVNTAFSQTFTATNTIGAVTFTTASTLPAGLTLATNGTLSGTPTQTGTFPIVVHAVDANGCAGNGATYNLTIGCQVITVNNPATNSGTVNTAFSQSFTATNAIGAVTFTTASTLPTGITLAANGTLSGTPTQTGTFPIVVHAVDANGCAGNGATYNLTIGCQVITVNNPATNTGTVNVAFSQNFTASNTIGAVSFSTASTLPAGLTLATNGTLSGTPTQTGTFPIVVHATDANGCAGNGATYNLTIGCQVITVTNPGVNTGTANSAFSQTFTAGNTIGTVIFSTASALPSGLTLAANGTLSGTPTQTGTFPIVVTATDANGCSGSGATYNLTIGCQTITVNNPATNTGTVNAAFSQSFSATNAIGTTTFTTASTLPAGLTLATNGTLSGTPTQIGTFPIVVTATDANGCQGTGATYNLTINCQTISVTNPVNTVGTVSAPFSETFTAGNTVGTVTFSTASTLPTGLTLDGTTGVLSGTPMVPGTFPIVVTATDANGCSGNGPTYNLIINCQTITVTNPTSNSSPAGTALPAANFTFTQSGAIGGATFTTASTLPTGVTLTTAGVLTGTPTQGGSFPIVVTVTDGNGCTGTNPAYTLTITCPVITVTNPGVDTGTAGVAFSQQFTQSGGQGTVTFSESGALPNGFTFDASTGVLSGTTTDVGAFPITVTATDQNGCQGVGSQYNLTINCQTITVTNPGVNTGTVDAAFSQTFLVSGILGTVTWSETGALPAGITLDASTGVLSGTPTVNGVFPITVKATDTNGCFGTSSYTLTINCQSITVNNPGVTTGTVDAAFSQTFTQSGAHGTATFSTASTLPAGLTLSTAGVLSGTPGQPGVFPITVTVTDSNGCTGTGATYTLTINCQTITVNNPGVNTGTVGQFFSQTFTQTGVGTHTPVTWSFTGTLPTGFTLDPSTGVLSGTTNQFGSFSITVKATDANGCFGTSPYTLIINCQTITVTNPANTSGTVNAAFSEQFQESGGIGGGTFSTASTLPIGLSLDGSTGVLSGTPTQSGTFPITVTFTDGNGCSGSGPVYTLVIGCQTITVTNPANSTGTAGVAFSEQFQQSGAVGTVTWSESGPLPTGITLNTSTGVLFGTTNQVGTFPITVTATDGNGCQGTGPTYNLTINCQTISVTNPTLNTVQAGTALTPASSWTFSASGILGTATWSITSGTLPSGVTLNTSTGVLSGTSTQQGNFPITVKVTDTNGCFATSAYTLTVTCPTITPARNGGGTFPAGTIGTAYNGQSFTASGGTAPYSFAVTGGTFPPGLSLASNGTISGTPTATGTFLFTVTATDNNTCTGSAGFSIAINPSVGPDSYSNLVNNTQAVVTGGSSSAAAGRAAVPLTGTITANDTPAGGFTLTTGTFSTTNSGSVTIASDGTFVYTPPVASAAVPAASDTFTYTITSDTGGTGTPTQATGTVTLNITNRVWYVDNTNGGTADGRSNTPFNTLAAAQAASFTSDYIYIYTGSGTTGQDAGITLKNNQLLWGQGSNLVINSTVLKIGTGFGTGPTITNTGVNGDVVTLADGNTVQGLLINGATRDGISGNGKAGFTGNNLTVSSNGGSGLHLVNMTGTCSTTNSSFADKAATPASIAVDVSGGLGAVTVDSTNTITTASGRSVSIQARTGGTLTIGATVNDSGSGVLINNSAAGSPVITFSGGNKTLNTGVNTAVTIQGNTGTPTVNFASGTLSITTTTGTGFSATGGGTTLTVTTTANVTTGAAANGIVINNVIVGASGATFNSVNTTGATTGVSLTSIGNGNVTINGGTISGGTTGLSMTTLGTSTVTLSGVTFTGSTTAISGSTFGTLAISGSSVNVSGATALNLATGAVSGTFNNVSSTGGTNGVNLNAVTGSWGTTAGSLTGATGSTYNVTGGSGGTISWGGTINQANGADVVHIATSNSNTINFSGNVTTSGTSTGINISGSSGTYNFTGAASTIAGTGGGITVVGTESGTISFGAGYNISAATTSFKIGGTASNVSANITYGGVITNNNAGGVLLDIFSAGTGSYTGTLLMNGTSLSGNTNGAAGVISVIKNMTGTLTVNNLSLTSSNNTFANTLVGISGTNTGGTFTFNHLVLSANGANHNGKGVVMSGGGSIAITATGGNSSIDVGSSALDLNGVTLNASAIQTLNSLGPGTAVSGVSLVSVTGVGALTISGGAITGIAGAGAFVITNGNPSVTYNGTISQSAANKAINVSGVTGGTFNFGGAITGATSGTGITFAGTGGTVNFTGGITLNGTADTFSISGAGVTVSVTGTNSVGGTTAVTSGPAVSISNAAISSSNVTFQKVSCTGGSNGIFINNTGTGAGNGSFIITGNAGAGTGGTIATSTGADGTTNGIGIYLASTKSPSLSWMQVNDHPNYGIYGTSVAGLTLDHCVVNGSNGTNAGLTEASVGFDNLSGSATVSNCTIQGGVNDNMRVTNSTGTLNRITFTSDTFNANNAASGNADLNLTASATGVTLNATVQSCNFTGSRSHSFQMTLSGNSVADLIATGNTFSQSMAAVSGAGDFFVGSGGGGNPTFTYNISTNTMNGAVGNAINVTKGSGTGTFTGTINANIIGTAATANSGSTQGSGITVFLIGGGTHTTSITNNQVRQFNDRGIFVETQDNTSGGNGTIVATITGNVVKNPGAFALHALHIEDGAVANDAMTICATIGGAGALANDLAGGANDGAGGGNGGYEIRMQQRFNTTLKMPGYGGAATDTAAVATYLAGRNTLTAVGTAHISASASGSGSGYIGGASCP